MVKMHKGNLVNIYSVLTIGFDHLTNGELVLLRQRYCCNMEIFFEFKSEEIQIVHGVENPSPVGYPLRSQHDHKITMEQIKRW